MEHSHQAGEDASLSVCAWHPDVETRLSCSYCARSICTNCLVQAPVGIRCRECAKTERLPTFDVQPVHYTKGLGVALAVAIAGGVIWYLFNSWFDGVPFVAGLFALAVGYAAGELISLSVNRKRNILLSYAAGASVIIAFLIAIPAAGQFGLMTLVFLAVGVYTAYMKLR